MVQDPGYALRLVGFTSIKCPSTGVKSEECISEAATSLFNVEDGLETLNAKSEGIGTVGMLRFLDVAICKMSVYSDVFRSVYCKQEVGIMCFKSLARRNTQVLLRSMQFFFLLP